MGFSHKTPYSVEMNWWIPLDENFGNFLTFLMAFNKYKYSQSII